MPIDPRSFDHADVTRAYREPERFASTSAVKFLLVHSPLVGPRTWGWVAEALTSSGHDVAVPDLRQAAATGEPNLLVRSALPPRPAEMLVLVAHSGAGFFLPLIAERLRGRVQRLVFVDAGIPPAAGEVIAGADFLDRLRSLATNGVLPKWSMWWGEGVMEALVPDHAHRAQVEAEMPEVPLALYESPVTLPRRWRNSPGAFILLSDAYQQHAETARSLGWPVIERLGTHLDIVNDPVSVAQDLLELVP